jgi:hypothetical protein
MRNRYFSEDESIPGWYRFQGGFVIAAIPIEYEFENERRLIEQARQGSIAPAWQGEPDKGAFLPAQNGAHYLINC